MVINKKGKKMKKLIIIALTSFLFLHNAFSETVYLYQCADCQKITANKHEMHRHLFPQANNRPYEGIILCDTCNDKIGNDQDELEYLLELNRDRKKTDDEKTKKHQLFLKSFMRVSD